VVDSALWARMAADDEDALAELYERHYRAVHTHCFRLTASATTAEELTAQTFVTMWRKRATTQPRTDDARPWLLTVAANLARNERRAGLRRARLVGRVQIESVRDPADDVASRVDAERQMAAVLRQIATLPRAEREALELCVWAGVSYADAAAQLGLSESSVRARVSRARSRLSKQMEESS
jgi:RNA polymerase sigma factor (sigma-70 family)